MALDLALILLLVGITRTERANAAGWADDFGPPGVDGGGWYSDYFAQPPFSFDDTQVFALAVSGDYLYIGGTFTSAGGVAANYIARWHKNSGVWEALGAGLNESVTAIAIDGNNLIRVFSISAGSVTLSGLTIRRGLTSSEGGGVNFSSTGTLTVTNSIISNNTANGNFGGGGIYA